MDWLPTVAWCVAGIATLAGLYALHRWLLRLEARGVIYYWHKRPEGSSAGSFVALQKFIEPTAHHIHQVKEQARPHADRDAGGPDDPT